MAEGGKGALAFAIILLRPMHTGQGMLWQNRPKTRDNAKKAGLRPLFPAFCRY